jgi:glycerol-3-phosphate acyltransferase PlsX
MGSIYSKYVLGIENPQVGLLNMGEEPNKGNDLAIKTYQLLKDNPQISFRGNAEGRDVLSADFDVIVCDGFIGNILLKFAEAIGEVMLQILKEELPKGIQGKIGTLLLKQNLRNIKQRIDHAEHGGALLFGVPGVCIISHGSSKAASIFSAIRNGKQAIENQVMPKMKAYLEETHHHGEQLTTSEDETQN